MVNWQRGVMRLFRITNHEVVVTGVKDFTPNYRRIHFSGPELLVQLDEVFPTLWTRLWFPHPEKGDGHLSQRGYTFSAIDLDAGTFSLDFVLHGDLGDADPVDSDDIGPGARWAAHVRPGATIEAALTPARLDLPDDTAHLLLAGDLTALPAINSWCEAVPAEVTITVAITADPTEVPGLPQSEHPNATWHWMNQGSNAEAAPQLRTDRSVTDHLRGLDLDSAGLYVWAAGERSMVKEVRRFAKGDLGLGRSQQFSQFYWFADKPTG
ncbi:ATP-binding cassette, subfamily B, IrtA [Brevibacterium siliguriense]|uniref:ATP-binding cassette, subfamily B, IrtA n=1 Tax=Brevibacterium siliguriense TaxID=1136497 RepID=A0A1H1PDX8_9MICO|nr:SIP domain-containing protein [Brevibacterium siliguriense]SDS08819.1 ATP-binding cassette, subfamily B, IrtA [Brevibacterium siliguriense]